MPPALEYHDGVNSIFVTGGSTTVTRKNSHGTVRDFYVPTTFHDPDVRGGLAWGHIRSIAAALLARQNPSTTVVTLSSSRNTMSDELRNSLVPPPYRPDAEITAELVREKSGGVEVVIEPRSLDTFSEMLISVRMIIENGWKKSVIVTTTFQKPRAEAMLKSILSLEDREHRRKVKQMIAYNRRRFQDQPEALAFIEQTYRLLLTQVATYQTHDIQIDLLAAEDILVAFNPRYRKLIEWARRQPEYTETLRRNEIGAEQWRRGEYGKLQ